MGFDDSKAKIDMTGIEEVHTEKVVEYINNPRNLQIMQNYDGRGEKTARIRKQMVTII
ncbi:MAG: hypothetical protein IMY87_07055 [Chloroflexi bacterium]|jgi:hypothetical protein|nr:hypothetical protein [Chloroflexota bacterium]